MLEAPRPALVRYGVAVTSVALATVVTLFIPKVAERAVFIFYFVAVAVSVWYGGLRPGLVATALSALASAYFFLHPAYTFLLDPVEWLRLGVFVFVALLINALATARRRAEAEAERNRRWLDTTLRSIGDAVVATDMAGQVIFMNAVAERLTGWGEREARGRSLGEVFHIINEETRAEVESPVTHVLRSGQVVGLANHTVLVARDGTERPIEDSAAPIRAAGVNTGVVLVFRDATEQRRQALTRAQLAAIVASSDDAIFGKTLDGVITSWNAAAERMYGYTAAEAVGQSVALLIPPERPDELPGILARLRAGERLAHFETVRQRKDGTRLHVSLTISPLTDASGQVVGVSTIARDVTARRQADEELQLQARVLTSMAEGVCVADEQGYIRYTNPAEDMMFGYEPGELTGQHVTVLNAYPAPENERRFAEVITQLRARGAWYGERENRKKDGTQFQTFARITALHVGAQQFWVCVHEDITERKRVESEREELLRREQALRVQAEAASRTKDEFLATVSHELRTPLTAILGWARLLRGDGMDAPASRHAVTVIERNARAQAQLIEDLLDISRIITGRLRLEQATVDLVPVVHSVLDSVRLAAEAKEISLHADYDAAELAVTGDAARLQQVVWNLLTNAVKFTPPGGRVEVRLARRDGHARLVVSDTGVGIAPEFLPYVFERFRQADQSTSRSHGGLGLGLAIVRHLVELHGGQVEAESAGEGQGARFTVALPLQAAAGDDAPPSAAVVPAPVAADTPSLAGLRVLVVDDDKDTRDYLLLLLARHGAQAEAAGDAAAALAELKRTRYDLLLSDIGMPGTDGYDLIRQLRDYESLRGEHTPALALTAYARTEDSEQARAAGYEAHLPKPVEPAALVNALAALAGRAG
ncbi:MAG TPA: PAS domain S-box protein [Pyrinomonadaceae bacterium]|jgi:PAS domain S-box-containing protein